ncbi:hypothetical protein DAPPUDRAFT_328580 [Daphnia pulex]|uniref:Uncharacterized protein n=1 Tax=Daphnia pulex TaxID=6669 RepID=E9HE46_DAPPU|nr:hypothetical protein DAPPUDRAFT_328580 [Daphnia pulex]|eukprot:EFX69994.1 hypothetical protein DAPPUDRAFT_328580 [Daphnia pulex]
MVQNLMYYYTYEEVKQLRDVRVKSKAHPSTQCSALVWLARVLQKFRFINQQEYTPLFRQLLYSVSKDDLTKVHVTSLLGKHQIHEQHKSQVRLLAEYELMSYLNPHKWKQFAISPYRFRGLLSPSVQTNSSIWIENNVPSAPFFRPSADHGPPSVFTNTTEIDVWSTAGLTTPTGTGE